MRLGLDLLTHNWSLKLVALGLAILLWSVTSVRRTERPAVAVEEVPEVPVDIELNDPDWVVARPPVPATVSVRFTGPTRELVRLLGKQPRVVVSIEQVRDTVVFRRLHPGQVRMRSWPDQVRAAAVRPDSVRLHFRRRDGPLDAG